MLKTNYFHKPNHIWSNNQCYFITATVYRNKQLFNTPKKLDLLRRTIFDKIEKFQWEILVWAIMPNHYHFIANCKIGKALPKFIKEIHGKSAFQLNKIDSTPNRQVWQNYWDVCLYSERDYFQTMNYIHLNPVKHGFAKRMSEYEFSSFNNFYQKGDKEICESFFQEFTPKARLKNE